MLTANAPRNDIQRLKNEAEKEKTSYRILFVLGCMLFFISMLLEIFTGKTLEDKGMWSIFSLVGFGMALVFGLILKRSHDLPAH